MSTVEKGDSGVRATRRESNCGKRRLGGEGNWERKQLWKKATRGVRATRGEGNCGRGQLGMRTTRVKETLLNNE